MTNKELDPITERELEILSLISEGASDREIAQKLYLSINTVKWHNRQIYQKLGVTNRTQAVALAAEKGLLDQDLSSERPSKTKKKHNLPAQITSFVGRDDEIGIIKELVNENRLVTLTGPGGVGKTRLALQVSAELVENEVFPDGVFFTELAVVSKPEQIGNVILDSLDLPPAPGQNVTEILESIFDSKSPLLVLDNFEHLLKGAGIVKDLLNTFPDITVLCTSREALNLYGEVVFPLLPLTTPEISKLKMQPKLDDYDSVKLFISRARAIKPDFIPTDDDLSIVAQICVRLDGLPLAIELAAARLKIYSLPDVLKQLEDRFASLKGGPRDAPIRHQTLQQAIDWSYDLLSVEEKILFNRLSAFQGSRTIKAVEEICCFDLSLHVMDGLESLSSKNLINQKIGLDGETRFYMLESIHEYASQCLQKIGEEQGIYGRHSQYFAEMVETAKPHTRGGPDQVIWLKRLEADYDNLRVVYTRTFNGGDLLLGLRLVGALDYFWLKMYHLVEGKEWSTHGLELMHDAPPNIQASVYASAGATYYWNGDIALSKKMCYAALNIYEELEDWQEMGWMHAYLMYTSHGNPAEDQEFRENFEKGINLLEKAGDKSGLCQIYTFLGVHERDIGNYQEAKDALERSTVIAKELGDRNREVVNLFHLGHISIAQGDPETAQQRFLESLRLELSLVHEEIMVTGTLEALTRVALEMDQPERALILLSATDVIYKTWGELIPQDLDDRQELIDFAYSQMEKESFEKIWEKGQSMDFEQVILFALEEGVET